MNAKLLFSAALFAGAVALGPPRPARADPVACWSGYHPDRMGNCQPDNPVLDTRCQPGYITQVFPNGYGYICVPIPKGY